MNQVLNRDRIAKANAKEKGPLALPVDLLVFTSE